jgi:serine protease Do
MPNAACTVSAVTAGSVAARAGFREGDDLRILDGQPLFSIADVSWALHHAPESGSLESEVRRGEEKIRIALTLPAGWRNRSDISRRVGTWTMRAMALGGLQLVDLSDEERRRRDLSRDQMALLAKHVGQYGEHAAAMKAGFQKDDVLVGAAGWTSRQTEGELIGQLLRKYQPGDTIPVTVLRGNQSMRLQLPIQ